MRFYSWLFALALTFVTWQARADIYVLPNLGAGYDAAQGTFYRVGLDVGYTLDQNWYFGWGAYYAAGEHPSDDREIGTGPFVGYNYPILSWLGLNLREDLLYVDEYNPEIYPDGTYTHEDLYGTESATYAGIHIAFTRNFGISAGYRLVLGISNTALATDRSGTVLGLTIGI